MNNFLKYITPFRKLWHFLLFNAVITLIFVPFFYSGWLNSFRHFILSFLWGFSIFVSQWLGHVYINFKLTEKYPWQYYTWRRSILALITIPVYSVVAFLLVQFTMMRLILGGFPANPLQFALTSSLYSISIAFAISLVFTTIGFFKAWKISLLEAEKLKTQMLAYKYEALQNQINPHFLFNSFNVLTDLVYDDPKKAASFINQLSQLFRYVLDNREKELVMVADELQFLNSFVYLLKTRFENKLSVNIELEPQANELMVPMGLQLLVENCVKHNEVSSTHPLIITVKKDTEYIEVTNNINPKNTGVDSKKTGLANLKQQYRFFTDKEVLIDISNEYYSVKVPIIKADEK